MSVSSNPIPAAARVGGKGETEIDPRQPSVDGLHSPSSPNAPAIAAKHGEYVHVISVYRFVDNAVCYGLWVSMV